MIAPIKPPLRQRLEDKIDAAILGMQTSVDYDTVTLLAKRINRYNTLYLNKFGHFYQPRPK